MNEDKQKFTHANWKSSVDELFLLLSKFSYLYIYCKFCKLSPHTLCKYTIDNNFTVITERLVFVIPPLKISVTTRFQFNGKSIKIVKISQ